MAVQNIWPGGSTRAPAGLMYAPTSVLVISPLHDWPTVQSDYVASQLAGALRQVAGVRVAHLQWMQATRKSVQDRLERERWDMVVYFGHGERDRWRGGFWPVAVADDAPLFGGVTIVYAMACDTLAEFGAAVVAAGARAYVGNTEAVYGTATTRGINPAHGFKSIWMNEVLNLVRGVRVHDAVSFATSQWTEYAARLRAVPGHEGVAAVAEWNAAHHGYRGDPDAALPPREVNVGGG